MKRYKMIRIPVEAFDGFNRKKLVMQNIVREELRKPKIRFTFADTLRYVANKKIMIYNDELIDFIRKNKIKQKKQNII